MTSALALSLALLAAGSAQAVGLSAELGTTGLGAHLSVPLQENLNARFGVNALNYSFDGSTSNVNYDFKLKLQTFDALLDFHPMAGAFRISAGLVYNNNKIDAVGRPNASGSFTLNGTTYTAAQVGTLNGNVDFRKMSPYLGIGWGNAAAKDKGWGFTSDLGVLFQGSPTAHLSSNCNAATFGQASCDALASSVRAEEASLNDKLRNFRFYPVVRVGVSYRF
ncbi:hypothetical protein [Noviherbaspirillum humi]|nr:hypothetical protein [Noviherbaspirillum humi]